MVRGCCSMGDVLSIQLAMRTPVQKLQKNQCECPLYDPSFRRHSQYRLRRARVSETPSSHSEYAEYSLGIGSCSTSTFTSTSIVLFLPLSSVGGRNETMKP